MQPKAIASTPASASSAPASVNRGESTIARRLSTDTSPPGRTRREKRTLTSAGIAIATSGISEVQVLRSITPTVPRLP